MDHTAYDGNSYHVSDDWMGQVSSPIASVAWAAQFNLDATVRILNETGFDVKAVFGEDVEYDKIKFTDWSPDTCGCQVQYVWHRDHSEDVRVHHPHKSVKHCVHHEHLNTDHTVHSLEVHRENQHKNHHRQKLAEELGVEVGEVAFDFDKKRTLRLSHPKLAAARLVHREE